MLTEHYKAWTENYLTVWEDLVNVLPSKEEAPEAPLTKEMYMGVFQNLLSEVANGVAVTTTKVVMGIGRKSS